MGPFILLNLLTGFLLEIGRKIRLPEEEEDGVGTYSKVWGRSRALIVWFLLCIALTILIATQNIIAGLLFSVLTVASIAVFIRPLKTKIVEAVSSVWLLTLFIAWGYFA